MSELLSFWLLCAAGWDHGAAVKQRGQVWGRGARHGEAEKVARLVDELRVSLGCLADAPAALMLGRLERAQAG